MLDQVTRRVTATAETAAASKDEEAAGELFAVERFLASATRRLERLLATYRS